MKKATRRQFVAYCSMAAAGMSSAAVLSAVNVLHMSPTARKSPSVSFPSAPHDRIAVASYPFREFIAGKDHKPGNPVIELQDFAAQVTQKFGVRRIEPWSAHFPATDAKYLDQFRAKLDASRAALANIAVDGDDSLYAADRTERERAVAFSRKWIDIAAAVDSPSVRTNIPEAKDAKPDLRRLGDSLQQVAEYGEKKSVVVHLENDNPVSEDPFFLVQVIDRVNSPWLRALPDFGNTLNAHNEDYSYRAIDAMFSKAYGICHVKDGEVNEKGVATHVDLARTFDLLKLHEYQGYCSIEYDAPGDPFQATAELIKKTQRYLAGDDSRTA